MRDKTQLELHKRKASGSELNSIVKHMELIDAAKDLWTHTITRIPKGRRGEIGDKIIKSGAKIMPACQLNFLYADLHELMDTARAPAMVLRDGRESQVTAASRVPGDVLLLAPGHQVPADARLLATEALAIDESSLTGESLPVDKRPDRVVAATAVIGERPTMLYAGTIVSEGTGRAMVVATGAHTEAARVQLLSASRSRPQAPVEAELEHLGGRLASASLIACGVFAGIGILRGYPPGAILKDAIALAVAAVPEGLPVVATTTLSYGLRRMEKRGILIREISAVESMGALQTICLDKTGTLTENRMAVVAAAAGLSEVDCSDRQALSPLAEVAILNNDSDGAGGGSPT